MVVISRACKQTNNIRHLLSFFTLDPRRVLPPAPKVLGAKHISNPDFGAILKKGEGCGCCVFTGPSHGRSSTGGGTVRALNTHTHTERERERDHTQRERPHTERERPHTHRERDHTQRERETTTVKPTHANIARFRFFTMAPAIVRVLRVKIHN